MHILATVAIFNDQAEHLITVLQSSFHVLRKLLLSGARVRHNKRADALCQIRAELVEALLMSTLDVLRLPLVLTIDVVVLVSLKDKPRLSANKLKGQSALPAARNSPQDVNHLLQGGLADLVFVLQDTSSLSLLLACHPHTDTKLLSSA